MSKYYEISTLTDNLAWPLESWYSKMKGVIFCDQCRKPYPHLKNIDVYVESPLDGSAVNWTRGILILCRELIEHIGRELLEQYLFLGKVYDRYGNTLSYETVIGKYQNTIRGNAKSEYRRCNKCNAHSYFPMGHYYMISCDYVAVPISMMSDSLIVNEEILERIKERKWKKLGILEIPVIEHPRDKKPLHIRDFTEKDIYKDAVQDSESKAQWLERIIREYGRALDQRCPGPEGDRGKR